MSRIIFLFVWLGALPLVAQVLPQLDPLPAPLQAVRGVHPRLYLTPDRIAELKKTIATTHTAVWLMLKAQADELVTAGPPPYETREEDNDVEQEWQRPVGNAMPVLAMAYRMTGDAKYLESARDYALASCSYPTWGFDKTNGTDLAAAHQLFGLAMAYDWCFDDLGEPAKKTIRETLIKRGAAMYNAANDPKMWWSRMYLQNHLWVNLAGLQAAGLAIFDEHPAAGDWIASSQQKLIQSVNSLGPDGASHEGAGYWGYGVEYLLKMMSLSRDLLGINLYDRPWWKNTEIYYHYLTIPRNAWTKDSVLVDLADCPRNPWYGPDYLLRALAHEYNNGDAQWLAQQFDDAGAISRESLWLNLLWLDPKIKPVAPAVPNFPTLRHFQDMGIVSARSTWAGDGSLVVFKCGPILGHAAIKKFDYDPGSGHVHPDANHFVIFGEGEWQIRNDGYHQKWTRQENTLLVSGKGQLGEGDTWFDGLPSMETHSEPQITRVQSFPQMDFLSGDATTAYDHALGLQRYRRHLIYLKPDVLIVVDDIAADKAMPLELRFHPESHDATRDGAAVVMHGKSSLLRVEPLTTEGVRTTAEDVPIPDGKGKPAVKLFTIGLSCQRDHWRQATAFSWSPHTGTPVHVSLDPSADTWHFRAGTKDVFFDWKTQSVRLP